MGPESPYQRTKVDEVYVRTSSCKGLCGEVLALQKRGHMYLWRTGNRALCKGTASQDLKTLDSGIPIQPRPQRLLIFHLILGGQRKPDSPYYTRGSPGNCSGSSFLPRPGSP